MGHVKREIKGIQTCALYANSDNLAHAQSITRAFVFFSYILWYTISLFADREGPDQPALLRRLIRALAVRIYPNTRFRLTQPIWYLAYL